METIAEKTTKIIADLLGEEQHTLTPETDLYKDLGADSLDVVDVIVTLEKEFGVAVPDEKIERMTKVKHFIDHFEKVRPIPAHYFQTTQAA
jgi:acyl carrier protein